MKRFDPSQLSAFLAVAEHRSFRHAAIALDVTPSALSHALRAIEQRLDVRLVNRTTRSVSLTEAGERLFRRVSPAFKDIQDAVEDLNEFRDQPFGTIRLNAARQAAHLVLLPLVGRFVKRYPDIRVEIVIDNTVADIVAAGFDAGVRLGELVAADMIAVPIGDLNAQRSSAQPSTFGSTVSQRRRGTCIAFLASAIGFSVGCSTVGSSNARGLHSTWM